MIRFSDGVNIDTSGPLRKLRLADGLYVVGQGMSIPCDSDGEAETILDEERGKQLVREVETLAPKRKSRLVQRVIESATGTATMICDAPPGQCGGGRRVARVVKVDAEGRGSCPHCGSGMRRATVRAYR